MGPKRRIVKPVLLDFHQKKKHKHAKISNKVKLLETDSKEQITKVDSLKQILNMLKKKGLLKEDSVENLLTRFQGLTLDIFRKREDCEYSSEVKQFASALLQHSSNAYDYCRSFLSLPHPSIVWISKSPVSTTEAYVGDECIAPSKLPGKSKKRTRLNWSEDVKSEPVCQEQCAMDSYDAESMITSEINIKSDPYVCIDDDDDDPVMKSVLDVYDEDPLCSKDLNEEEIKREDDPVSDIAEPEFCGIKIEPSVEQLYEDETNDCGSSEQQIEEINLISDEEEEGQSSKSHEYGVGSKHKKPSKKSYKCSKCGASFSKSSDFSTHMFKHFLEKPFQCSEGHEVVSLEYYDENMVLAKKYLPCFECFKIRSFGWGSDQQRKIVNFVEKPYKCFTCPESFHKYAELKKHVSAHKDNSLYPCKKCKKSFSVKYLLIQHERIHKQSPIPNKQRKSKK